MAPITYDVIVGNIGCVYSGADREEARRLFTQYVDESKSGVGRAANEEVYVIDNETQEIMEGCYHYIPGISP